MRSRFLVLALAAPLALAACSSTTPPATVTVTATPPASSTPSAESSVMPSESMAGGEHSHPIGDGTTAEAGPYTLSVDAFPASGQAGDLMLSISSTEGKVTEFAEAHTKRMHLILVPQDLSTMLHVHPEPKADGSWAVPVTFPFAGPWRVVADVAQEAEGDQLQAYIMGTEIEVPGPARVPLPIPSQRPVVSVDGFEVSYYESTVAVGVPGTFSVRITRDGKPVTFDNYLGHRAYLSTVNSNTYAYARQPLAAGPQGVDGVLTFDAKFDQVAFYRFFFEFSVDGVVHTAPATVGINPPA